MSRRRRDRPDTDPARARLVRERPRPDPGFAQGLRHDAAALWAKNVRPAYLWALVAGLALLAIALAVVGTVLALR